MGTVLIAGGGIAGPATALALHRAGIDCVLYEARDDLSAGRGSYLTVASNGFSALRAVDADVALAARSFPTPDTVLWSGSGKRLGRMSNGALADGTVSRTIRRADLNDALFAEVSARGIPIEFGKRVTGAEEPPGGGVRIAFADGSHAEGSLLVAADGVHSRIRRFIDPTAPRPRYVGLLNFGGYTADPPDTPEPGTWHMVFGRRAFFGYTTDRAGGTVWFANVPQAEELPSDRLTERSRADWKAHLVELFAGDRTPAAALVAAGRLEFGASNTYDLPPVPTWHTEQVVLVGDAAHATSPSSGQGASMAVEDAVELARCLRDVAAPAQAFATYDRLRRQRVEKITAHAARISSSKAAGPVGRVLRDLLLPLVLRNAASGEDEAWMYRHHIDWDAPVALVPTA